MKTETINLLLTEQRNPRSHNIDELSTLAMVQLMNSEDQCVIDAIRHASSSIARAIDAIVEVLKQGGRLVYIGAGTSGRLGVLDAAECLPTFGVGEEQVVALIAGGDQALRSPIENAEDDRQACIQDLDTINFNGKDILCAIAASGRTPYCLAGLEYAQKIGAQTIALTCTDQNSMVKMANIAISVLVGAEVITGSTRLKAGSAQKMVLNMLTTCSMVKLGKTYGNLMVDLKPTNEKLHQRVINMLQSVLDIDKKAAQTLANDSRYHVKTAILMHLKNIDYHTAKIVLDDSEQLLSRALKEE